MHEAGRLVLSGRLEKVEGSDEVRINDRFGRKNAAVDVRLGGEMHDRLGLEIGDRPIDRFGIANIAFHESVARIVGN